MQGDDNHWAGGRVPTQPRVAEEWIATIYLQLLDSARGHDFVVMGMGGHLTCVNVDASTDGIGKDWVATLGVLAVDLAVPV
ncbi:MAG: hypothetical protein EHM60_01090 [Lysobacterales bacterium]|jgi:hypothetical protein|nr:MAG: hypothetical protein EHM60_01090 [Xanthomonadales bacterium]